MPKTEIPIPQQIVVGETPLYLKTPINVGDTEVTSVVIQSSDKRSASGVESSMLVVREPSRKKGEEGQIIDKPVMHVDTMDQMAWDKISGIQWTDEAGVAHIIPKEELTLEKPATQETVAPEAAVETPKTEAATAPEPLPAEAPAAPEAPTTDEAGNPVQTETAAPAEPIVEPTAKAPVGVTPPAPTPSKEARKILETLQEDPNTITIVGLRAYETRALDLADRSMQRLSTAHMQEKAEATKNLWDKTKDITHGLHELVFTSIWKQSIGGIFFHERARQYYMDMLKTAETPFAEQSIRLAEARATERYNKKMADSNFIVRAGTKAVDWLKDKLGMRSAIQNMALEEIGVMKAAGELKGAEVFEREAKAVRARFSQDMDKADQFVRTQLGEKLEILDATKEEHKPLVEGIQGLLKQYATGEIPDRAEFDKRAKEFFNATLKNVRPDIFAEAELYSSSLFDAAETLRMKMSHEGGLANIDEAMAGMQIRLGIGSMGEVTSLEPTAVEKGIGRVREVFDWLNKQNVIVPMVFNEAAIGSGVAIALSAFNLVKTMPARAMFSIGGGAIAGGLFAGWKEYGQLQKDYLTHLREREVGTQFTESMKRRAWFERFSVKQRSANEMIGTLQSALYENDVLKASLTDDEVRSVFATVADLHARKAVSETGPKQIGLVQYSGREGIESERTALDITANKALADIDAYLSAHQDQATTILGGNTFADFMVKLTTNQTQVLKQGTGAMATFDDPVKATLGLVSEYAPEAAMMKRRWPFAGKATTPDEKAMGMDAILAEFNNEARLEAVKYGVKAGVIGAAVGVAIQGVEALAHNVNVGDLAHKATQNVKDTIQNNTEPSVYTPGSVHTETVSLSAPSADHVVHIGSQTYQIPKELDITPHTTGSEGGGTTLYNATFHVNGPVHDVAMGQNMTQEQLFSKLHEVGLTVQEGQTAGALPLHDTVLTLANGNTLHTQLPPGLEFKYIKDFHDWTIVDTTKDPANNVLMSHIHIDNNGSINGADLSKLDHALAAHFPGGHSIVNPNAPASVLNTPSVVPSIHPDVTPAVTPNPESVPLSNNMTITGSELSGRGGLWDYFLGKAHGDNNLATANGMKNLFRLYEHQNGTANITTPDSNFHMPLREATLGVDHGKIDVDLARFPNDAQIKVPESVFGQHGIDQFITIQKQGLIDYQNALTTAKSPMDAIQHMYDAGGDQKMEAIVLKLGYIGQDYQLPNPQDVSALMAHISGTAIHTAAPTGIPPIVPTVPIESPVTPTTLHEIIISANATTAAPGQIIADHNTIILPFSLPSEVAQAQTILASTSKDMVWPGGMDESVRAALHEGGKNVASEIPWFPVILPVRSVLEAAPMEALPSEVATSTETFYFPLGNESAFITKESMDGRKSPRLTENPQAKLSQSEEVAWYLSQLPAEDTDTLAKLVAQHDAPMSTDVRTVITLPTSSNATNLTERLTQYATQTNKDGTPFDPKKIELVVYDINPAAESTAKADVDKYIADHPDAQVTYLSHTYEGDLKSGRIKRDLSNYVLSRMGTLPADHPDVLLLTDNTVPGMTMQPTYIQGLIDAADANPAADILHGTNMLPNEAFAQYPMLFASHRAFELFDAFVRHGEAGSIPNVYSGNMAVRASSLAAIGGYNADSPGAEDRELSWMMRTARGTSDAIAPVADMQTTIDPKETVYYQYLQPQGLAENVPMETNDTYKDMSWSDMAKRASENYTKEQLESNLSNMYTTVYPSLKAANPARFDGYFKRTMDAMGVQYEIQDNKVVITDMSSLEANMAAAIDTEAFAKQTAGEVVAATQPEPSTPRETLAAVAGPQETPPETPVASTSDTMASSISSPDVVNTGETTTPQPQPEQAAPAPEQLPEGVEDRVNYVLNKTKESTAAVDITTGELMDYLKSRLEMAGNTRITDGKIVIDGTNVNLNDMVAKSPFAGEAHFNGTLVADAQKGLTIDPNTVHYDLPLLMRLVEGRIKNQLNNFNDTLIMHLGQRTPKEWKAERIDVVGTKIEVKFAKKSS